MYRGFVSKLATYLAIFVGLLCVLLLYVMNLEFDGLLLQKQVNSVIELPFSDAQQTVTPLYILLSGVGITAVIATIVSIVITLVKHPKQLVRTLVGAIVCALIVLVSYFVASSDALTSSEVWISTGLYTLYSLTGIAVISVIFSEVRNSIIS